MLKNVLSFRAVRALLIVLAGAATVATAAAQTPIALSPQDRQLLGEAWQHTAGVASYDYRVVVYDAENKARVARLSKWDPARGTRVYEFHADSLVDVDPALRVALAQLYTPRQRSQPVRWLRKSGATNWAVLELVQRGQSRAPRDVAEFDARAQRWLTQGLLPAPADLATDTEHRSRAAYWRAITPEAVNGLPPELSPNVQFGNAMTPLTQALLRSDIPLVQALLARGANPSRCAFFGCPLQLAVAMADAERASRAVEVLLAAGSLPNQRDGAYSSARQVPLNEAARLGRADLAKRLLDAGASADGAPGVDVTPVAAAVLAGRRDLAQLLIDRGASVLPYTDRARDDIGMHFTLVRAAQEGEDKSLEPWAETMMMNAALAAPDYQWNAHLEQGGKRIALVDGGRIDLRAAPFKLVPTLPAVEGAGVTLAASFSPKLGDDVRKPERRNGIFVPTLSSALSEPPKDDSYELLLYEAQPPAGAAADRNWGGRMDLANRPERQDFHERRAGKNEYVREFRSIAEVSEDTASTPVKVTPLTALGGRSFTLALGAFLPTEAWVGRLVAPRVVTVNLK